MRLKNKVALIVGGASGMGASITALFAREGAKVIVADIDNKKMEAAAKSVKEAGGSLMTLAVDIVDEQQVRDMVETVVNEFNRIDILVNTVGTFEFSPAEDLSVDQWHRLFDINLTGVFICCREVGKVMIGQKSGKIVNFASTAGLSAVPYSIHYTAAKHGVVGLTKALGVEWAKHNINVNCICPGATATPMLLESTSEEFRASRSKRIPLQRFGKPQEQAGTALFLASPDSDYVTGSVITVDGGVYAMAPGTAEDALTGKP